MLDEPFEAPFDDEPCDGSAPAGALGEVARAAPETASAQAAAPAIVGRARWVRRGSSTVVLIR